MLSKVRAPSLHPLLTLLTIVMIFQVLLVSLLLIASEARPAHRSKRGLGLIKLGYDWATQGLSAGISDGLLSGFSDLSTGGKIGAGLMIAKPIALTLLGKCKYKTHVVRGSNISPPQMRSMIGSPRDPMPASRQIWDSDLSKLQATLALVLPTTILRRLCLEVKF